jgi:uncharacterized protein YkwD
MAASKTRLNSVHHRKRYGHHQKRSKPFLKTYLPYLPLMVIIITFVTISLRGLPKSGSSSNVLAYATSVESGSLLQATNTERANQGQKPLKLNPQLNAAAQAKANDMARRNYWSHVTPDGKQPWSFLDAAGYSYRKAGENLAYGFATSQETIAGWMNSPTHKANLLDASFEEVGFGFANSDNYQNTGPETIVVAMYGKNQLAAAAAGDTQTTATGGQLVRGDSTNFSNVHTYRIARIQVITNGQAPWILGILIIAAAVAIGYLAAKHTVKLHRMVKRGEKFAITHPLLDVTVVAFIALCIFVSHTEGYILSASF